MNQRNSRDAAASEGASDDGRESSMTTPRQCEYCGSVEKVHDRDSCDYLRSKLSADEVEGLLDVLPYSSIPTTWYVATAVRWFLDHGWKQPMRDAAASERREQEGVVLNENEDQLAGKLSDAGPELEEAVQWVREIIAARVAEAKEQMLVQILHDYDLTQGHYDRHGFNDGYCVLIEDLRADLQSIRDAKEAGDD